METKLASHQRIYVSCEAEKTSYEPKMASARVIWIKISNSASCEVRDNYLSASSEANLVFGCETILAFHSAKL